MHRLDISFGAAVAHTELVHFLERYYSFTPYK